MSTNTLASQMEAMEKAIRATDAVRTEAITKKQMYEETLKEQRKEFEALGTTPELAAEKMKALEKEIQDQLAFIEAHLPIDLLKQWGKL